MNDDDEGRAAAWRTQQQAIVAQHSIGDLGFTPSDDEELAPERSLRNLGGLLPETDERGFAYGSTGERVGAALASPAKKAATATAGALKGAGAAMALAAKETEIYAKLAGSDKHSPRASPLRARRSAAAAAEADEDGGRRLRATSTPCFQGC